MVMEKGTRCWDFPAAPPPLEGPPWRSQGFGGAGSCRRPSLLAPGLLLSHGCGSPAPVDSQPFSLPEFGVHLAELTVDPQGALAIRQVGPA